MIPLLMLMIVGFFKRNDAVIFGNDPGTHLSELIHLIICYPDLRGLKLGEHSCFYGQFEQDLGDVLLGAADFFFNGLGDDGCQIVHILALF